MKNIFEKSCYITHRVENLEKINDNFSKDLVKCFGNQKSYLEEKENLKFLV